MLSVTAMPQTQFSPPKKLGPPLFNWSLDTLSEHRQKADKLFDKISQEWPLSLLLLSPCLPLKPLEQGIYRLCFSQHPITFLTQQNSKVFHICPKHMIRFFTVSALSLVPTSIFILFSFTNKILWPIQFLEEEFIWHTVSEEDLLMTLNEWQQEVEQETRKSQVQLQAWSREFELEVRPEEYNSQCLPLVAFFL